MSRWDVPEGPDPVVGFIRTLNGSTFGSFGIELVTGTKLLVDLDPSYRWASLVWHEKDDEADHPRTWDAGPALVTSNITVGEPLDVSFADDDGRPVLCPTSVVKTIWRLSSRIDA